VVLARPVQGRVVVLHLHQVRNVREFKLDLFCFCSRELSKTCSC
jgi:hypothetical protein